MTEIHFCNSRNCFESINGEFGGGKVTMLNKEQLEAIKHDNGAALVLAGPGTGKTTVITKRIIRLLEERKALPGEIVVVTFTKVAAAEMKERFHKEFKGKGKEEVVFGTFHSIFYSMLRQSSGGLAGTIIGEKDKALVIREIMLRLNIGININNETISGVVSYISRMKNRSLENTDLENTVNGDFGNELLKKIYAEYKRELNISGKWDFDDIIINCKKLLEEDSVRLYWQRKFKYILVDEFQDINRLQFECLTDIVGKEKNIFAVGDDDQAIYRFRGSDVTIMQDFVSKYNAVKINLKKNYRSSNEIVKSATGLIARNAHRFEKHLETAAHNEKCIGSVTIKEYENNIEQYRDIMRQMEAYNAAGIKYEEMAVLLRNNGMVNNVASFFEGNNRKVSTFVRKQSADVSEDIAAYIYASVSDMNMPLCENQYFVRIVNKPNRMIGMRCLADNRNGIDELKNCYRDACTILREICELEFQLKLIKKMKPYAAVNYILTGIGYEEYIVRIKKNVKEELVEIRQIAAGFDDLEKFADFLKKRSCENIITFSGGVNITTMHASKGKEYKIVFLPDVNDKLVPDLRTVCDYGIEEERRLFYVAMTRAKYKLHISYVCKVMGKTMKKSQFIEELGG